MLLFFFVNAESSHIAGTAASAILIAISSVNNGTYIASLSVQ